MAMNARVLNWRQIAAAVCLLLTVMAPAHADNLRVGGSGSTTALARLLAEAYNQKNPQDTVTVTPALGTSGGLKALHVKAVDMALVSRPLSEEEKKTLMATEFARTPFVFTVGASNPRDDITFAELVKLYRAPDSSWPDGTRVRLVLRPLDDNDSKIVSGFSPAVSEALLAAHARPGALVAATDEDAIAAIQRLPGGFGTTTLGQILTDKRPLKALALEGKKPSVAAIRDGSYAYYKRQFVATTATPSAVAQRFTAFLVSVDAQNLLAAHGCWVGEFAAKP